MRLLEVHFKGMTVPVNRSLKKNQQGYNLLTAKLFYPSAGKPLVVTTRKIEMKEAKHVDESVLDLPLRLLFKEEIQATAYMQFELSTVAEPTHIAKWTAKGLGLFSDGASNLGIPGGSIVTGIISYGMGAPGGKLDDDHVALLGCSKSMTIDREYSNPDIAIDLFANEDVTFHQMKWDGDRFVYESEQIHKNDITGTIRIAVTQTVI